MAESWLIFVDTNVFLDFYRLPGESAKRQLAGLEDHKDRLIISEQIQMEFLKNRQKVIIKALRDMKKPAKDSVPQILVDSSPAKGLIKSQAQSQRKFDQLKERASRILSNPSQNDRVYQTFNRIFDTDSELNLCRPKKVRFEVRNHARKRFVLGYPPRKGADTSIGDSINWEWIIRCAASSSPQTHILIVSRDGDYGVEYNGKYYLNDWLLREFKKRLSQKRRVELTPRLTDALKRLNEAVTDEDIEEEENLLNKIRSRGKARNEGDDLDFDDLDDIEMQDSDGDDFDDLLK